MNNEWNIHFLQNMCYIQIVLRKKYTMNKMLILFKIQGVFKKYQD